MVMLALGILGLVMMASPTEPRPVEQDGKVSIALGTLTKRGWSWPEKMTSSYSGLQALLEDVAQGIEERQAELEEMTRGIEDRQNELKKVAKSMEDRQAQLEKAAKEIEDKRIKRIEKEIELTTSIPEDKITDNFAEELVQQGHMKEEEERIPGLKVMGVFIGCRILMTLGWEG
jgi:chromosome segregation ATPase